MKPSQFFATLGIGMALGVGMAYWGSNAKINRLQAHADSVAVQARRSDSLATAAHDSAAKAVAKLDRIERAAEAGYESAQKRVKVFHDALHAMVDSNAAAKAALDSLEQAHADEVARLKDGKDAADGKVLVLQAEVATQLRTIHDLSGQVADLNARIQKLNSHALPKWFRTGFAVIEKGLAVKGLVDVVQGK